MATLDDKFEKTRGSSPLLMGFVGGGIAVLISKVFDLLASGIAGQGYNVGFPADILTVLFIAVLVAAIFFARPRRSDVQALADDNDRRLAELDARLRELQHGTKR